MVSKTIVDYISGKQFATKREYELHTENKRLREALGGTDTIAELLARVIELEGFVDDYEIGRTRADARCEKLEDALGEIEKYDGNSCSHCQNIAKQAVKGDE